MGLSAKCVRPPGIAWFCFSEIHSIVEPQLCEASIGVNGAKQMLSTEQSQGGYVISHWLCSS